MAKTLLSLLLAMTAAGAQTGASVAPKPSEDAWAKVGELKTGVELRIFKIGSMQPLLAKMDESNDERLVVILKDQQVAIPKEQIDRIDYRPAKSKMVASTRTETKDNSAELAKAGPPTRSTSPTVTSSTTYTGLGKPDFETIYRRRAAPPKN